MDVRRIRRNALLTATVFAVILVVGPDHWFARLVALAFFAVASLIVILAIVEDEIVVAEVEDVHPAQENGHYRRLDVQA